MSHYHARYKSEEISPPAALVVGGSSCIAGAPTSSWNPAGPQRLGLGSAATAAHQCNFPPDEFDQRFKT